MVPDTSPGTRDLSVSAAIDRLTAEFDGRVQPRTVSRTVRDCRRELDGAPPPALPELVERLARARILESAGTR